MDVAFQAAFTLLKLVAPAFVLACKAALKLWELEEYQAFKDSVYSDFIKALNDKDCVAVRSVLSFSFDVTM